MITSASTNRSCAILRVHEARPVWLLGPFESFNGRLRDQFFYVNEFVTMNDVRQTTKAWQATAATVRHTARSAT